MIGTRATALPASFPELSSPSLSLATRNKTKLTDSHSTVWLTIISQACVRYEVIDSQ